MNGLNFVKNIVFRLHFIVFVNIFTWSYLYRYRIQYWFEQLLTLTNKNIVSFKR